MDAVRSPSAKLHFQPTEAPSTESDTTVVRSLPVDCKASPLKRFQRRQRAAETLQKLQAAAQLSLSKVDASESEPESLDFGVSAVPSLREEQSFGDQLSWLQNEVSFTLGRLNAHLETSRESAALWCRIESLERTLLEYLEIQRGKCVCNCRII